MNWSQNMKGTDFYIEQLPEYALIKGKKCRLRIKRFGKTQWLTRYLSGRNPNYKTILEVKSKNLNHGAKVILKQLKEHNKQNQFLNN